MEASWLESRPRLPRRMMKNLKVTFGSFGILLCLFLLVLVLLLGVSGASARPDNTANDGAGAAIDVNVDPGAAVAGYGDFGGYHARTVRIQPPSPSLDMTHGHYSNGNHHHRVFDPDTTSTPDHDHPDYDQQDGPGTNPGSCRLPSHWKGKWFQSGFSSPLAIDDKSIGHKGLCLDSSGTDKFLFYDAPTNCHKCVVIIEHHNNVLQYKESQYCEDKNTLENLCSEIPGDASLYSLFRIDAQPIDCPFKGAPFTFTYNRGHGECRDPVSHVDTCTDSSRLLLRYQACPNVQKTESTSEELECLATWKDGSNHYLIGKLYSGLGGVIGGHEISNEERYRCFVYEAVRNHSAEGGHAPIIGYKVAQSGDASCTGVTSTDTGARALTFMKAPHVPVQKCKFPAWVGPHHWYSLDSRTSVKLHTKGSILFIQEEKKNHSIMYSNYGAYNTGHSYSSSYYGTGGPKYRTTLFNTGARIVCQTKHEISDRSVTIKAVYSEGCKSETICLNIYKRHHNVIELKIQKQSAYEDGDCTKRVYPDEMTEIAPYITLVGSAPATLRCPNLGKYMASGVKQDGRIIRDACGNGNDGRSHGSFNTLVVGCDDEGTMKFHSKCASEEPITSYTCHGNWEEAGTRYLIASPSTTTTAAVAATRSPASIRRYCFIYTQTDGELRVSSSRESCRRNISPGISGSWAFNLTANGHCAERLTGDSSPGSRPAPTPGVPLLLISTVILHLCVAVFSSSISATTTTTSSRFPTR